MPAEMVRGLADTPVVVSRRVLIGCICAAGTRLLVVGALPAAAVAAMWSETVWETVYLAMLVAIVLLFGAELVIAAHARCPACGARLLVDTARMASVHTVRREPLGHVARTVVDVLGTRRFSCMHCGQRCHVGPLRAPVSHDPA